jgi:hypothetical protein
MAGGMFFLIPYTRSFSILLTALYLLTIFADFHLCFHKCNTPPKRGLLHTHAVIVAVGVASPVPLVGHIQLNGANFMLRLCNLSSPSSVNLKKTCICYTALSSIPVCIL